MKKKIYEPAKVAIVAFDAEDILFSSLDLRCLDVPSGMNGCP